MEVLMTERSLSLPQEAVVGRGGELHLWDVWSNARAIIPGKDDGILCQPGLRSHLCVGAGVWECLSAFASIEGILLNMPELPF